MDLTNEDWTTIGGISDEDRQMHIDTINAHIQGQTVFGNWAGFLPEGLVTETNENYYNLSD